LKFSNSALFSEKIINVDLIDAKFKWNRIRTDSGSEKKESANVSTKNQITYSEALNVLDARRSVVNKERLQHLLSCEVSHVDGCLHHLAVEFKDN